MPKCRASRRAGRRKDKMWWVQVERDAGKTCFLGFGNSRGPETDTMGKEGAFPQLGKSQTPPRSKGEVTKGAAEERLKKNKIK